MGLELILIRMERSIRESGWMICSTGMGLKLGLMDRNMKEFTVKERNMAKELMFGLTAPSI